MDCHTNQRFVRYFGHLPHVFRGPRTSVAVLNGQETDEELRLLGDDIFAHFGMGCRSVTKVWLPEGFDLDRCFARWTWNGTEREGFEPSTEVASCNSLAGSRFQPLSHLSSGAPRVPSARQLVRPQRGADVV